MVARRVSRSSSGGPAMNVNQPVGGISPDPGAAPPTDDAPQPPEPTPSGVGSGPPWGAPPEVAPPATEPRRSRRTLLVAIGIAAIVLVAAVTTLFVVQPWKDPRVTGATEGRLLSGHTQSVSDLDFSPDGKRLISGSHDDSALLWNVAAGKQTLAFTEHDRPVDGVAFHPDGKSVATASWDGTVRIWDTDLGTTNRTLSGITLSNTGTYSLIITLAASVAFSPDKVTIATGGGNKTAQAWTVLGSGKGTRLPGPQSDTLNGIYALDYSPDAKMLAGTWDSGAVIWSATTRVALHTLREHEAIVAGVAFSPDSKTLATASWDGTVRLWATDSGKSLATLDVGADRAYDVAFTPDGRTLAIAATDGVQLWDVASRRAITTLPVPGAPAMSIAVAPDGKTIAGGDSKGNIRLWRLTTD